MVHRNYNAVRIHWQGNIFITLVTPSFGNYDAVRADATDEGERAVAGLCTCVCVCDSVCVSLLIMHHTALYTDSSHAIKI